MIIYSLDVFFSQFGKEQSIVPCPVLTVASLPEYRFLRRQIRWSGIPSLEEFSTVCCDEHSQRL